MNIKTLRLTLSLAAFLSWQIPSQAQWVQTNGPYYSEVINCFAVSGTNLFAGTDGDGVFLSTNNGTSWTEVNNGLTNTYIYALAVNGSYLFAGTTGSVWRRPLSEMIITSVEEPFADQRLPEEFSLEQNYPNPFNPTTTICYTLPKTAFTEIKIIDMLGRTVASLVAEEMPAGLHYVIWDGQDDSHNQAASGMYMYSLMAADHIMTRKLMLIR